MELREIEIFLTLAEELHFGRTADRLHVSTARVSQTVSKLERRVGAALFERTSRRVTLTEIGRALDEDLRPAYDQLHAGIERAIAAGRGVEGQLRVGFVGTAVGTFVLRVAEAFQKRHPACRVEIEEISYDRAGAQLATGAVNLLLVAAPSFDPEVTHSPVLFEERALLAVSARHQLVRRTSTAALDDLAGHQVLRPRSIPDELDELSVPTHTPSGTVIERGPTFSTVQEMFALVGAGQGVFPVPEHAARYDSRPDIVYLPTLDFPAFQWRLLWRTVDETSRIRAYVQAARDYARKHPAPLLATP